MRDSYAEEIRAFRVGCWATVLGKHWGHVCPQRSGAWSTGVSLPTCPGVGGHQRASCL